MKKIFLPVSLAMLMLASCDPDIESKHARNNGSGSENGNGAVTVDETNIAAALNGGFELAIAEKVSFGNLNIYPVKASNDFIAAHGDMGKHYKTLKEGVESGDVVVSEHAGNGNSLAEHNARVQEQQRSYNSNNTFSNGTFLNRTSTNLANGEGRNNSGEINGPTVNSLSIENKGEDTVLVMAGELVRGGDQDRVVAEDMLLKPHSGAVAVSVFCVESGRWSHEGYYNNSIVFGFTNNFASNSIRKIVTQDKNQEEVWNRVGQVTMANNASSQTNSYNQLEKSEQFTSERQKYLSALQNAFSSSNKVIGVVVTDKNNKVMACDLFCNADLFKKEYKGLIHAYITEAISGEGMKEENKGGSPEEYFANVKDDYKNPSNKKNIHRLVHKGKVVHYSRF